MRGRGFTYQFSGEQRFTRPWYPNEGAFSVFQKLGEYLDRIPHWVWGILLLSMVVTVTLLSFTSFFVRPLGKAGVIRSTLLAEETGSEKPFGFKQTFNAAKPYYWRFLLIDLLVWIARLVIGFLLVFLSIGFIIFTLGLGLLFLIPFLVLLIPVGWFISIWVTNTTIAVADENLEILPAIEFAWHVTLQHFLSFALVNLILWAIRALVAAFAAFLLLLASIPAIVSLLGQNHSLFVLGTVFTIGLFILGMAVIFVIIGGLNAYTLAAQTLTYRQIKAQSGLRTQLSVQKLDTSEENS